MTKQIISLSHNAADRIKEIMSKAEKDSVGVRVGVKSGGCAGMSYIMEYTKKISPNDEVIEDKGVKLFVDPGAIIYLLGTEMDYKKSEFSSSFVFIYTFFYSIFQGTVRSSFNSFTLRSKKSFFFFAFCYFISMFF